MFRKTLIINSKVGQLGNTLLMSAHVMAYATEHQLNVINIPFDEYANLFQSTQHNLLCSYPSSLFFPLPHAVMRKFMVRGRISFLAEKLVGKLQTHQAFAELFEEHVTPITISWSQEINLDGSEFLEILHQKKVLILNGWKFRAPLSMSKYADTIRSYFTPLPIHQASINTFVTMLKEKHDVVIGIHIRQGDYRRWVGGRFFYETFAYQDLMKKLEVSFPQKRVAFLVASNVDQQDYFADQPNVFYSMRSVTEDLYGLACCDYIVGPPSTFSLWASFYGKTPLYQVYDIERLPSLEDFRICSDLNWSYSNPI